MKRKERERERERERGGGVVGGDIVLFLYVVACSHKSEGRHL